MKNTIFDKPRSMIYQLLLFILVNAGISVSATRSSLTLPVRKKIEDKSKWWGQLFNCPMCLGFYTSIPVYFWIYKIHTPDLSLLAFMFIGSFTSFFLYKISNIG